MFILLLLISLVESDGDECEIVSRTDTTKIVGKVHEILKTSFAKLTNGSPDFPTDFSTEELIDYAKAAIGFVSPILAVFLIMFIYYICVGLFSCCCCKSKKYSKPGLVLTILHLIFAGFLCASIVMLYFSASRITVGIVKAGNTFIDVPDKINDVFDVVYSGINDVLETVEGSVQDITDAIQDISTLINDTKSSADSEKGNIVTCLGYVEGNLTELRNATEEFDNTVDSCSNGYSSNISLSKYVDESFEKVKYMNESLNVLDTDTLDELLYIAGNTSEQISLSVTSTINELRDVKIPELIEPFTSIVSSFSDVTDKAKSIVPKVEKFASIASFALCGVLSIILILYVVFYFFSNSCSRCLVSYFWFIGFLINLLMGIITVVFAILFVFLYVGCPELKELVNNHISEYVETQEDLYDVLICNSSLKNKNLLFQFNIDFDIDGTLKEVQDELSSGLETFNLTNIASNLTDLISFQPSQNLTIENIFPVDISSIESEIVDCSNASIAIEKVKIAMDDVSKSLEETLAVSSSFTELTEGLVQSLYTAQSSVTFLSEEMVTVLGEKINNTVDELTCKYICRIYVPIENSLCSTMLDGISLWVISFYCLFVALFGLSITLCIRRLSMFDIGQGSFLGAK